VTYRIVVTPTADEEAMEAVRWHAEIGRELRRFEGHCGAVSPLAFTPDGRSIVSGSEDATVLVWDVSDLKDYSKTDGR
jgi:WD40 repeat protein